LKEENLKLDSDVYFIVHKMEGRAFILGRNGFYNKAIDILKKNDCYQVYFVFIFKNETEEEMKTCLDNLIQKGDQKELEYYMNNNQIIYINESYLGNKEKNEKLLFFLSNSLFMNFICLKSFENIKLLDNGSVNVRSISAEKSLVVENIKDNNDDNIISNKDKINDDANNFSAFYYKYKRCIDDNIYYTKSNNSSDNFFTVGKNFYDEKKEILEKLKFIKIFQKFSKEKFGETNSNRFNCDIL